MKLTIIATENGGHQQDLIDAAKAKGMDVSIRSLKSTDLLDKKLGTKLGDALIWRSSNLDLASERPSLGPLIGKKIVVSDAVFTTPAIRYKYYQQQMLSREPGTAKWSIPTFRYKTHVSFKKDVETSVLTLPVIAKPNAGSRGEGIELIRFIDDVDILKHMKDYVFQAFIPNSGDWRVIVVGGVPLGVLLRRGQEGEFLNNVSQGAHSSVETDPNVQAMVCKIATKTASLFHLAFCGVDIIRNAETGEYSVLEVNTAPQWRSEFGFQEVTGTDVAGAVIDWVADRNELGKSSLSDTVEWYYKSRIEYIPSEAFHFASRLWLWSSDSWARQQLDDMKADYIGATLEETQTRIKAMVEGELTRERTVNQNKAYRKDSFEKYDNLSLYGRLLFKTVFCDSVYDVDIRPYIREYIKDKQFIELFNNLIADEDAVRLLSTHAINYFYLLKNYFKDKVNLSSTVLVSPQELLNLLPGYDILEDSCIIDHPTSVKLQIYLLTHAIIGESRFYARAIKSSIYKELCRRIEALIKNNYYDVSLDNKLEFLVCSQICGYESPLRAMIEQEAEKSVSWAGNFVVDTYNALAGGKLADDLRTSEHRNVLYLMSQRTFIKNHESASVKAQKKLPLIGRLARIKLDVYDIRRAIARVDSGATRSSISASNVFEKDGSLHFTLLHPAHPLYTGKELVTADYKIVNTRNTSSREERYAVALDVEVAGVSYNVLFGLADRQTMHYPMLLGRNFLTGRYTVDTAKQFIEKYPRLKKFKED